MGMSNMLFSHLATTNQHRIIIGIKTLLHEMLQYEIEMF